MQKMMFGRTRSAAMALLVLLAAGGVQAQNRATGNLPKYGLYIHFSLPTFHGYNPRGNDMGFMPPEKFAPTGVDARGWARTAKQAGMDFAVLTVKHEDGFCLWPAKDYDYHLGRSPVKVDIVGEYIAACNAEGIKPGVHYSIPDAYGEGQVKFKGPLAPAYFETVKKHVTDLHTKYPGIRIQIFDVAGRLTPQQFITLCRIVKQSNPSCMVFQGGGHDPNHQWTVAVNYGTGTVNKNWFWSRDAQLNPAQQLFNRYSQSASKGDAFVLNVGVDTSGRIPNAYVAVLMEVKALMGGSNSLAQPTTVNQSPLAQGGDNKGDRVERLKKFKQLFEQGLITKEQYDLKLKEVLDSN